MSMRWRRVGRFVQHYRAALGGIVVAGVLCLALVLLHKMLAGVHFKDVRAAIAAIGPCGRGRKLRANCSAYLRMFSRSSGPNGTALMTISLPRGVRIRPIRIDFG